MALTLNGTTGLSGIAGSAGTPALQGNNDANTGYFFGTDTLGLSTAGTERLRITSDGDVGIGVSPSSGIKLHIKDTTSDGAIKLEGTGSTLGTWITLQNNDATANSYSMIQGADAGGQGTSEIKFINVNNSNNEGTLTVGTRPSGGSMQERLRIKSNGQIGINMAPSADAQVCIKNSDDSNYNVFDCYNANGNKLGGFSQDSTGNGSMGVRTNAGVLNTFFRSSGISYLNGGSVGIGTSSPSNLVHIEKSHADPLVVIKNTSGQANEGACLKLWASGRGSGLDDEDIFVINDTNNARNFGVSNAGTVHTTGNIVMASGKGINFSATSDAGGRTSELLDDYEEGTWTPALTSDGTMSSASGTYTKVGRLVHVKFSFQVNQINSASTTHVTGLPYSAAEQGYGQAGYFSSLGSGATNAFNSISPYATGTTIYWNIITTANAFSQNPVMLGNSARCDGTITYTTN